MDQAPDPKNSKTQKTANQKTPRSWRPAGRGPNDLRPLPMRISQRAYQRLERLRDLDDITIQEHVRRGLDYYLDHAEVSIALSASEALKDAQAQVKSRLASSPDGVPLPGPSIVPSLLAKHAPRPVRNPVKVTAK